MQRMPVPGQVGMTVRHMDGCRRRRWREVGARKALLRSTGRVGEKPAAVEEGNRGQRASDKAIPSSFCLWLLLVVKHDYLYFLRRLTCLMLGCRQRARSSAVVMKL